MMDTRHEQWKKANHRKAIIQYLERTKGAVTISGMPAQEWRIHLIHEEIRQIKADHACYETYCNDGSASCGQHDQHYRLLEQWRDRLDLATAPVGLDRW